MTTGFPSKIFSGVIRQVSDSSGLFIAGAIGFLPLFLALRWYEFAMIVGRYGALESGVAGPLLLATGYDLMVGAFVLVVFALAIYPVAGVLGRWPALVAAAGLGSLTLIIYLSLIEYFVVTQVPLGADLFGYSRRDISATLSTSAEFSVLRVLSFVLLIGICAGTVFLLRRLRPSDRFQKAFFAGLILLFTLYFPIYPKHTVITSERELTLTGNKLAIFAGSGIRYGWTIAAERVRMARYRPESEFPLYRDFPYEDVLGPHFGRADAPPNIVIVGCEGLGKSFMPDGVWGGFTPVTERLAAEGLYFPNTIAASGRSFGFLPTIIGSLPPGGRGFMETGYAMPAHDTLITLLRRNGYLANYFVGFDSSFDNADLFLERQGVDYLMNERHFGPEYRKIELFEGTFTWGYADSDLFRRASEYLDSVPSDRPRLDIYHTVNVHEPFVLPDQDAWEHRVLDRIDELDVPESRKAEMRRYPEIFASILYTEKAIGEMIELYRRRDDFDRTIFIITGDHRLIPIPEATRIDRFAVPLIIWSPLVKAPARFEAVSTHADLTPSLLAFLRDNYGLDLPGKAHWLGRGLDVHSGFRSERILPPMRTKNELRDFLAGEYFLSGSDVFRLRENLELEPVNDETIKRNVRGEFARFRLVNQYVMNLDKIRPRTRDNTQDLEGLLSAEEELVRRMGLQDRSAEEIFDVARSAALEHDFEKARILGRHVLRMHPNYHDMRVLLGRSYAWDGRFDEARPHFREVIRRNPRYPDSYGALADLELWSHKELAALKIVHTGLEQAPDFVPLLFRQARALERLGRYRDAMGVVDRILVLDPGNADAHMKKLRIAEALDRVP